VYTCKYRRVNAIFKGIIFSCEKEGFILRNITKKIIVFSMIGIIQTGFGAAVLEASPMDFNNRQDVRLDDRHDGHDGDRDRQVEHDRRMREENERHEREMRRHDNESDADWQDRQNRENDRHNNALNDIAALVLGVVIGQNT